MGQVNCITGNSKHQGYVPGFSLVKKGDQFVLTPQEGVLFETGQYNDSHMFTGDQYIVTVYRLEDGRGHKLYFVKEHSHLNRTDIVKEAYSSSLPAELL